MKRVLFVATVDEHIRHFHLPYLKWFRENGFEVHVAANGDEELPYCDKKHNLPYQRTPFSLENFKANKMLGTLLDKYDFHLVHFHTPVASAFGRMAARKYRKRGLKVLYTAHGFHFFRGAPKRNWLAFYPAERFLARYTDALILMNNEDYALAQKFPIGPGRIFKIPGIGVDFARFTGSTDSDTRRNLRALWDIPDGAFLVLSVGELSERKNHQLLLRAMARLQDGDVHCLIAGKGDQKYNLERLCETLSLSGRVRFIGYQHDTVPLYQAADVFVFPSLQEGMPVALLEAMASGLPCVASRIRGNVDVIDSGVNGVLCSNASAQDYTAALCRLKDDPVFYEQIKGASRASVQDYSLDNTFLQLTQIYRQFISG